MRNVFLTVNKKVVALCLAVVLATVLCLGLILNSNIKPSAATPLNLTVVIDAGHGGADGGTVGDTTGITESELNLAFAKKLTKYLQNFGITVINTRNTMDGLYETFDENYKLNDMEKRKEIINNSGAQVLLSIHMNEFTSHYENGAQVFFKENNADGEQLANAIRDMLKANFDNARELALGGDFYILNCTNIIGCIVECGFLSNPTEEQNLQQDEYQNKMCYSIFCGIINYLNVVRY